MPSTGPAAGRRSDVPDSIAEMLLARLGDEHTGLRTRHRDWTWDEVVAESAARGALAVALRDAQFPDAPFHIGVLLDNVADFAFWLGGAALAGAVIVGINPTRGSADLAAEIRHADCQLIVTDTAGTARLAGLDLGLAADRFLVIDESRYPALIEAHRGEPVAAPGVGPESLLLLLFTSGTTGASKAVKCSQGRLCRIAESAAAKYGHSRQDVEYCCMPMFHGNALMALWAPALSVGATICLTPTFSASAFLPDVRFFGATFFTYVGKALAYLMATPETAQDADNTLTRGFGTEASPEDQAEFRRRFGAELYEGYGSSEGGNAATPDPQAPAGALGRPAHAGIAVIDPETLKICAPAQLDSYGRVRNADEAVGEIVDKFGARNFEGYYRNDSADAQRLRNGWYWTGDLGYVDAAGFLYFAGRRGDWIRVDGENISALTTERVLRRHPAVIAAAVFAVPDPRSGDQVMAALEVADPGGFDIAELADYLDNAEDLGRKGVPRLLRLSSRLPVTGSNKILKRDLQSQRWHTDPESGDVVHRWVGRGRPEYHPMNQADRNALDAEFRRYGRGHYL
ncbi:MAG: AMP-binding protein [Mycobacterium sp.]|nr:AMP-binding protein [Mycobacterium sp.]